MNKFIILFLIVGLAACMVSTSGFSVSLVEAKDSDSGGDSGGSSDNGGGGDSGDGGSDSGSDSDSGSGSDDSTSDNSNSDTGSDLSHTTYHAQTQILV